MKQDYSQGLMIGLGVTFMLISSIFVGLRVFAKRLGRRGMAWEDHLCFAALVIALACSILQVVAAIHGRLGQHQIVDENGMPVLDDPEFLVYERTKFAVNILAVVGLGLIKASFLFFYKSIFSVRYFRWAVYAMLCIVVGWTISYAFANLFTCWPVTALIEPFYGNKCINAVPMWLSVVYTDIIVDVGILVMPIPMVFRLQLPLAQKLGVLGMFFLGASVCAISITRLIVLTKIADEFILHYNDMTYYTSPVFFWTNMELSLAVVSACLPTLRPIWTYFRPSKPSTARLYGSASYELSGGGKRSDKFPSDQYTELDDIDGSGMGVDTTIRAAESRDGGNREIGRDSTAQGAGKGIVVHTSVQTSSTGQLL
ncbi:hypothetical protein CC78DRAFT_473365 [Lojkania enalia]|uniref:Rhodopsin domain-containing protein n=1 Tax=Lojkania enalia TaxID=147567 RepID=A0A9P4MZG9_9PLEO|nr:hypothetical protein CC78DRAFT_473365 [Didymosphaeria enalia]